MPFTMRELEIIRVLAANEAEDISSLHQQQLEREDITDADVLSYVEELKAIAATAESLITTRPDYGPDDEPPIEAFVPEEAEELYEPTAEDLAALDTGFEEHPPDEYEMLDV